MLKEIHVVADGSGLYLCSEAEDARNLCLYGARKPQTLEEFANRPHGGKTLYGWLFHTEESLAMLSEFDVTMYIGTTNGKVIECGLPSFFEAFRKLIKK